MEIEREGERGRGGESGYRQWGGLKKPLQSIADLTFFDLKLSLLQ